MANELRRLREQRGLSCVEAAEVIGGSPSKISRIETGYTGMQVEDVATLLGFYQVPAAKRDELLDLLKKGEQKGWWERQVGLPRLWRILINFENKATIIQNYEPLMIPGLLQTAEYSRALMRGDNPALSEAELDNLVASRMARQTLLSRAKAPHYLAVVHEAALRIPVGDRGVLNRQLRALLNLVERPNITLRVVPAGAGAHAGLRGSFLIMEFAGEPGVVHVENQETGLFLEEEADLASYRLALRNIVHVSLDPVASAEFVDSITRESA